MDPLAVHDHLAGNLLIGVFVAWAVFELVVRLRNPTPRNPRDPTLLIVVVCLGAGIALGYRAAHAERAVIGGGWAVFVAGFVLFVAGILLRVWAILTLGRYFTPSVQVQSGQHVVKSGPYRFVRHPSYTGMLLALLGLGIALDDWLSLLALALLPLIGLVVRIRHEESVLGEALGEEYREYAAHTSRLVPGVW
jgi:protein-S-isoprenylcysteine O-methyltransferase Ste14